MNQNSIELSEDLEAIEELLRFAGLSKKYITRVLSAYVVLRTGNKFQRRIFYQIFNSSYDDNS